MTEFMVFSLPDSERLRSIGEVSIRHAQLDHILKMTIKTLAGLSITEALDGTSYETSRALRESVRRLAKGRLGECAELVKLRALLKRCERVTLKRNELIHGVVGNTWEHDSTPKVRTDDHQWKDMPDVAELEQLAREILQITAEINEARLSGYLSEALKRRALRHDSVRKGPNGSRMRGHGFEVRLNVR